MPIQHNNVPCLAVTHRLNSAAGYNHLQYNVR